MFPNKAGLAIAALSALIFATVPVTAGRPTNYPRSYDDVIAKARAERVVRVYANVDTVEVRPLIAAFQRAYPGVAVAYVNLGSNELYQRFERENAARRPTVDVLWSSAMDRQIKLINDGHGQAYASPEKPALPMNAVWKNIGYGVTSEPVGIAYSKRLVAAADVPRTHAALDLLLRRRRAALTGKVATFDPARSGVGYLYLTQDFAITRDTASLVRSIAAARPQLFDNSHQMLEGIAAGRIAIAYNVLGSYAMQAARRDARIGVVFPRDYTITTSRIAFIASEARHPNAARLFLDFMLSRPGQALLARASLSPVRLDMQGRVPGLAPGAARPIRVGPQLLVNLDRIKRQRFLRDWNAALQAGAKQP